MTIRTWSGKVTPPADVSSASDVTISLHYLDAAEMPPPGGFPDLFLGSILDRSRPQETGEFTLTFDDSDIYHEGATIEPPLLALIISAFTETSISMWALGPYELNGDPMGDPNGDPLE